MLKSASLSGSRCPNPDFPSIPFSFPPSFADGREIGDAGCRGLDLIGGHILDFVTEPLDPRGLERSFRC